MKFERIETVGYEFYRITFTRRRFWLFGRHITISVFGDCTVWHIAPSMKMAGFFLEYRCMNLWSRHIDIPRRIAVVQRRLKVVNEAASLSPSAAKMVHEGST